MYVIRATYIPRDDIHFDRDYYVKHHIPLAQKLIDGRVDYLRMQVEFDMRDLMQGDVLQSPCVMVLLVETEEDVNNFKAFMVSEDVVPLGEDVKNYTNCDVEWTVAEVAN